MMDQRPVVSYDDITLPYAQQPYSSRPPLAKKRKWSNQKPKQQSRHKPDIRSSHAFHTDRNLDRLSETPAPSVNTDAANDNESRELTYEEIWDDSALINAWNAANEEYEAFNGPGKGWKSQPLQKSSLWYNVPPTSKPVKQEPPGSAGGLVVGALPAEDEGSQADSQPLNFETFVPSHDPSLDVPLPSQPASVPGPDYMSQYLPDPPGPMVTQDEAFARALGAMYWGGYWTAIYHCQKQGGVLLKRPITVTEQDIEDDLEAEDDVEEGEEEEEEEDEGGEELVSTQR